MADESSTPATPKPKVFRTRAGIVRKTKAERDAYAKQEAERASARAAAAANASVGSESTAQIKQTERRTRESKHKDGQSTQLRGSGVFGAGSGTRPNTAKRKHDGGRSEMLEGQEGLLSAEQAKQDPTAENGDQNHGSPTKSVNTSGKTAAGPSSRAAADESEYDTEHEIDDDEPTRDIEQIWLSDEDEMVEEDDGEEEDNVLSGRHKARATALPPTKAAAGLRPVRAARVYTDGYGREDTSTKGSQRQAKSSKVVQSDHDMLDEDGPDMELDEEQFLYEDSAMGQDTSSHTEPAKRRIGRRSGARGKDTKTMTETAEERAERARLAEDIRKMREEFVLPTSTKAAKSGAQTTLHDVDSSKDRLLLFQFPPLLPYLVDSESIAAPKSPVVAIKNEPDAAPGVNETTDNASASMQPTSKAHLDGFMTATSSARLPTGLIGKLKVHKSGKVTLDWGGTDMELRYGTEVDFLQDVVLAEPFQHSAADGDPVESKQSQPGITYALGQIKTKLVAIPDWQKLYD